MASGTEDATPQWRAVNAGEFVIRMLEGHTRLEKGDTRIGGANDGRKIGRLTFDGVFVDMPVNGRMCSGSEVSTSDKSPN